MCLSSTPPAVIIYTCSRTARTVPLPFITHASYLSRPTVRAASGRVRAAVPLRGRKLLGTNMIRVRQATDRDAMGVAQAHVRSWQVGYHGLISQAYLDALDPEDRASRYRFGEMEPEGPFTQVAVDGDHVCGHVTTGLCRDDDLRGSGEIWAIYVDPARWGTGVGRRLIAAGCEQLQRQGHHAAALWVLAGNARARHFYELAGWRWRGHQRTDTIGDDSVHEVRYERCPLFSPRAAGKSE